MALIRYKMYLKIKQFKQGFPVFRTRHKIHFSLNYLYLKSQFNTHTHTHKFIQIPLWIFLTLKAAKSKEGSQQLLL